jgi:hypothetical protein
MIIHVAEHRAPKPNPDCPYAGMHLSAEALLNVVELGPQTLGDGLSFHREAFSFVGLTAYVSETQEIEGLRFALSQTSALDGRKRPELDQASLFRVQREAEGPQTLLKVVQETFRFMSVLETQDEVVGVAYDDDITLRMTVSPLLCP